MEPEDGEDMIDEESGGLGGVSVAAVVTVQGIADLTLVGEEADQCHLADQRPAVALDGQVAYLPLLEISFILSKASTASSPRLSL